jgi:hypothetical protein
LERINAASSEIAPIAPITPSSSRADLGDRVRVYLAGSPVDQRGTGQSAPLDLDDPSLSHPAPLPRYGHNAWRRFGSTPRRRR